MSRHFLRQMRTARLFRKGLRRVEQGAYEQALSYFEELIEEEPEDAPGLSNVGYCNFRLGRYDAALAAYAEAVSLEPEDPQYICDLAGLYLKLDRPVDALEAFIEANRLDPDCTTALLGQAEAQYRLGNRDEALRLHQSLIEADPECAEAYCGLGLVFLSRHEYASAIEALNRALRLTPDDRSAYEALARAYEALGRDRDAAEAREALVRLQPDSPAAHWALGNCYARLNAWHKARDAFEQAVILAPDWDEARDALMEAQERATTDMESSESKGAALRLLGPEENEPLGMPFADVPSPPSPPRPDDEDPLHWPLDASESAVEESDEEPSAPTPDSQSDIDEGHAHYKAGAYDKALALWDRAAQVDGTNPAIHNNRAAALLELDRADEAIDACKRALAIQPDYGVALATLCEIYLQRKDKSALDTTLEHLRGLDPALAEELADQLGL